MGRILHARARISCAKMVLNRGGCPQSVADLLGVAVGTAMSESIAMAHAIRTAPMLMRFDRLISTDQIARAPA